MPLTSKTSPHHHITPTLFVYSSCDSIVHRTLSEKALGSSRGFYAPLPYVSCHKLFPNLNQAIPAVPLLLPGLVVKALLKDLWSPWQHHIIDSL